MMAYASHTGTLKNLAALAENRWGLVVSAASPNVDVRDFEIVLDNGAWTAFQKGRTIDLVAFGGALGKWGRRANFVVAPDIVAGGMASLELSLSWIPRVLDATSIALLAVQDGMTVNDVRPHVGGRVGIFVGGSTDVQTDASGREWNWKERTIPEWCALGREVGCYVHIGRVNTKRRIAICASFGADSFDGTSASMYSKNVPKLTRWRNQTGLFNRKNA